MTRYRLLALDIDGTLVGPDNRVPPELAEAVEAAQAAGLAVCLATGRSHLESVDVWRQLPFADPPQPMVTVGGALVVEPEDARPLFHCPLDRELAWEFADAVGAAGHSAMALVDPWRHGVDYYLAVSDDLPEVERRLIGRMNVTIRRTARLREAADMPDPLRVSALVPPDRAEALAADLRRRFDGRLALHPILAPNYGVTIVEAFAPDANKWTAVRYVAQGLGVPASKVVAVGDDINDVPMLRGAGLGVAVPHATPVCRRAADHVAAGGLAAFLHELLAGRFDGD